jgi:predicted ATP-binding protein involved in virulence
LKIKKKMDKILRGPFFSINLLKTRNNMKIKELHLTNFRGFEQLDIEFKNRLAVFIGVNGAGKTAVLDAICYAFIELVKGITAYSAFSNLNYANEKDIKDNEKKAILLFQLHYNRVILDNIRIGISIENTPKFSYQANYNDNAHLFFKIVDNEAASLNQTFNLPILTYYKSSKEELKIIEKENIEANLSQYWAYQNAFFHSINNFSDFTNWFKEQEDHEKDIIIIEQNFNAKNWKLEIIRNAISTFLKHLNGKIPFSDLKIHREVNNGVEFKANGNYHLTIKKANKVFNLKQLSEGEKLVLMLVCDIARRLTIANPSLNNPLEGEGIVLIDEIDLHLHPQWQREVIPALLATFPQLQFIVTTHSPQVLSKVEKESIYILEDGKLVENVPYTYGRNASAILFEIFGVTDRPIEIQDKINRCSQLLEEENYDKAKVLLKELTDLLGEHDEAVVGARTQLLFDNQMAD